MTSKAWVFWAVGFLVGLPLVACVVTVAWIYFRDMRGRRPRGF